MLFQRRQFLPVLFAALTVLSSPPAAVLAVEPEKKQVPLPPADAKPEDVVKNLYDRYLGGNYDYMDEKLRPRYFSKATDELLKKVFEKSEKDNEPGIDYEPLIDGQDGEVKGLQIVVLKSTPAAATIEARFNSFDDKQVVTFEFVLERSSWKLDDIRGKEGNSLKTIAKDFLKGP